MRVYDILSPKYTGREIQCTCGKVHRARVKEVIIADGATEALPRVLEGLPAARVFVAYDRNTERAAGGRIEGVLAAAGIRFDRFVFEEDRVEPDEASVGRTVGAFGGQDAVIGVGSGVINDICKVVAKTFGKPYIAVGTAPSMDGYCSSTSSLLIGGLKKSVDSKCPDVFIGDVDILKDCPEDMLRAGFGDMIAKTVALFEWRLGHMVTGEYYCPFVEETVRTAWNRIREGAGKLMERDGSAVAAVTDGLVISGIAMNYAGISRPASGCEHYFSHIWDMRGAAFGTPTSLHGIQCGIGTLLTLRGYEKLLKEEFDPGRAIEKKRSFDRNNWFEKIRERLGPGGDEMVKKASEGFVYREERSAARLGVILENIGKIRDLAEELLMKEADAKRLFESLGCPVSMEQIGLDPKDANTDFAMTRDVREKYILSTLAWDIGADIDLLS